VGYTLCLEVKFSLELFHGQPKTAIGLLFCLQSFLHPIQLGLLQLQLVTLSHSQWAEVYILLRRLDATYFISSSYRPWWLNGRSSYGAAKLPLSYAARSVEATAVMLTHGMSACCTICL